MFLVVFIFQITGCFFRILERVSSKYAILPFGTPVPLFFSVTQGPLFIFYHYMVSQTFPYNNLSPTLFPPSSLNICTVINNSMNSTTEHITPRRACPLANLSFQTHHITHSYISSLFPSLILSFSLSLYLSSPPLSHSLSLPLSLCLIFSLSPTSNFVSTSSLK